MLIVCVGTVGTPEEGLMYVALNLTPTAPNLSSLAFLPSPSCSPLDNLLAHLDEPSAVNAW